MHYIKTTYLNRYAVLCSEIQKQRKVKAFRCWFAEVLKIHSTDFYKQKIRLKTVGLTPFIFC